MSSNEAKREAASTPGSMGPFEVQFQTLPHFPFSDLRFLRLRESPGYGAEVRDGVTEFNLGCHHFAVRTTATGQVQARFGRGKNAAWHTVSGEGLLRVAALLVRAVRESRRRLDLHHELSKLPVRENYCVEAGQTLESISREVYGSADHAAAILSANRDLLSSSVDLLPGDRLRIPVIEAPVKEVPPAVLGFEDWLRAQPEAVQVEVLGAVRRRLLAGRPLAQAWATVGGGCAPSGQAG